MRSNKLAYSHDRAFFSTVIRSVWWSLAGNTRCGVCCHDSRKVSAVAKTLLQPVVLLSGRADNLNVGCGALGQSERRWTSRENFARIAFSLRPRRIQCTGVVQELRSNSTKERDDTLVFAAHSRGHSLRSRCELGTPIRRFARIGSLRDNF